jgi:hypothetical protein
MLNQTAKTHQEVVDFLTSLDARAAAIELANWLAANVENFVDNHETEYNMMFGDVEQEMYPILNELETSVMSLVRANEEKVSTSDTSLNAIINEEAAMLTVLQETMARITSVPKEDPSVMSPLFDRLKYFYEVIGFKNDGLKREAVLKDLDGYVELRLFEFDTNDMKVEIVKRQPVAKEDGSLDHVELERKTIQMSASFVVDFAFHSWEKKVEFGLF